jgi:hypothetical protein
MGKSILIGGALALLVVAGVVAALMLHVVPQPPKAATSPDIVAVAVVLPGADGIVAPRLVDVYIRTAVGWTVRSVSPSTSVDVPRTGGSTLADAYSFGGGDGLVSALAANPGIAADAWLVVDQPTWDRLHGSSALSMDLPADIEVFDGSQLYSFSAGTTVTVPPDQLPQLLDGATFLSASESSQVRGQVGDAVARALSASPSEAAGMVHTDMAQAPLDAWLRSAGTAKRNAGS